MNANELLSHWIYSMEGGELFQRIQDRQDDGPFTERGNWFA